MQDELLVEKVVKIEAEQQKVWEAWTDPERLSQWFCDKASGWPGEGATLSLTWERFGFTVDYEICRLRAPEQLLLKSRIPGVGVQKLNIELRRRAPFTVVSLRESSPAGKISAEDSGVESGWEMALAVLKLYVEKYYGRERRSFFAMLPAKFTYDKLLPFYTDPGKMALWLTKPGTTAKLGGVGEAFEMTLDNGWYMTGQVMAVTRHEVALSWDQIDGFLELKSFPTSPENKVLCLRGSGYGIDDDKAAEVEAFLKDALVRLFAAIAGPSAVSTSTSSGADSV